MFAKSNFAVWIGIILLSGMFLMGNESWPPERTETIVFVTQGTFEGELGDMHGADAICQAEANAAGLEGIFIAWLSDDSSTPYLRFFRSSIPYVLVDGTPVASDWGDLIDGELLHEINLTAEGNPINSGTRNVWTGTKPDGNHNTIPGYPDQGDCLEWTEIDFSIYGWAGDLDSSDAHWTEWDIIPCGEEGRLYCFEM